MQDFLVDLIYANPKPDKAFIASEVQIHVSEKLYISIGNANRIVVRIGFRYHKKHYV